MGHHVMFHHDAMLNYFLLLNSIQKFNVVGLLLEDTRSSWVEKKVWAGLGNNFFSISKIQDEY